MIFKSLQKRLEIIRLKKKNKRINEPLILKMMKIIKDMILINHLNPNMHFRTLLEKHLV
jgi:hypothetical protein